MMSRSDRGILMGLLTGSLNTRLCRIPTTSLTPVGSSLRRREPTAVSFACFGAVSLGFHRRRSRGRQSPFFKGRCHASDRGIPLEPAAKPQSGFIKRRYMNCAPPPLPWPQATAVPPGRAMSEGQSPGQRPQPIPAMAPVTKHPPPFSPYIRIERNPNRILRPSPFAGP